MRLRLVACNIALGLLVASPPSFAATPLPANVVLEEVTAEQDRSDIIDDFNDNLHHFGPDVKIANCDSIVNYDPHSRVKDTSFGGVCTLKNGEQVIMCNDRMIGEFSLGERFANTREYIGHFIDANCPGY